MKFMRSLVSGCSEDITSGMALLSQLKEHWLKKSGESILTLVRKKSLFSIIMKLANKDESKVFTQVFKEIITFIRRQ